MKDLKELKSDMKDLVELKGQDMKDLEEIRSDLKILI